MDQLPNEVARNIYQYGPTYREKLDQVLRQLSQLRCTCFIYRCPQRCLPWNNCYCYCPACRTYFRFCKQIYTDQLSNYEDELADFIPLE